MPARNLRSLPRGWPSLGDGGCWGCGPRVFAALLLSSAVTLAVAALALLSPLEHRFATTANGRCSPRSPPRVRSSLRSRSTLPRTQSRHAELAASVALLRRRSGAQITVSTTALATVYSPINQDLDVPDYYSQVNRALRTDRGVHTLIGDELVAAEPMQIGKDGPIDAVVLVRRLNMSAQPYT